MIRTIQVIDETQKFSVQDCEELGRFVQEQLLSTKRDRYWLDRILIRNDRLADYFGYWAARQKLDDNGRLTGLSAIIVLNGFYLKTLPQLKETLAHEYGHHWTLSYLMMEDNGAKFKLKSDRLPDDYYHLRGLNRAEYFVDYAQGWNQCDREVIAEDYRILFAPPPQTRHGMIPPLSLPSNEVKDWIQKLGQRLYFPSPEMPSPEMPTSLENPFTPLSGRIDQNDRFFNRDRELREIFDILNGGSGVELLGDRQMGKSSLLWQIHQKAETALRLKRRSLYLNLQLIHTETEFYEALCEQLGIATCRDFDFFRAIRNDRILLLLDEVEKMTWEGFTRNLRSQLRGLAEGENAPLRFVVATGTPLDRLFADSNADGMTSPFQGVCLRVELNPWDWQTVDQFITDRLAKTGIHFTPTERQTLWETSQGHPKRLMEGGFKLFNDKKRS